MTAGGPVEVGRYRYRHEAELRRELLENEGIASFVVGDDVGGMYAGALGPVRIVVAAEDAARAEALLAEWEAPAEEGDGDPPGSAG